MYIKRHPKEKSIKKVEIFVTQEHALKTILLIENSVFLYTDNRLDYMIKAE